MTNAKSFQDEWITAAEKDPYAALGLSLNAEDRRILKRYHQVAKLLHPDVQAGSHAPISQASEQLIARIINPAYQRLKQDKSRSEALANMRFRVRQLDRQGKLNPTFESAQQLLRIPESGRFECRLIDGAANLYLALAGLLAAGLEGIEKQTSPGERIDENLFARGAEFPDLETIPTNLFEALSALKQDSLLMDTIGELGAKTFFEFKEKEWSEFCSMVTNWEMDQYIDI